MMDEQPEKVFAIAIIAKANVRDDEHKVEMTKSEIADVFDTLELNTKEQRRKALFRDLMALMPELPETPRFRGRASNTSEEVNLD